MSDNRTSPGTTLSGATTGAIGKLKNISVGGISVTDVDVSHLTSTDRFKEFAAGMKDPGTLDGSLVYESGTGEDLLDAVGGENETWTLTFPDGSTFACSGYMKSLGMEVPEDGAITRSISIKLSGKPTFIDAS